jgi:hypothetical protein
MPRPSGQQARLREWSPRRSSVRETPAAEVGAFGARRSVRQSRSYPARSYCQIVFRPTPRAPRIGRFFVDEIAEGRMNVRFLG